MSWTDVLQALEGLQRQGLALLAALGGTGTLDGQPLWPVPMRLATELLALDAGLLRRVVGSGVALLVAGVLLCVALIVCLRRRPRRSIPRGLVASGALLAAAALLSAVSWRELPLVLAPAVPTSFHHSTTAFDSAAIASGAALFQRHCADCHGTDARGEGPRTASLSMWPPDLTGALLWRRREGELLWTVLHGRQGRDGRSTMPGYSGQLSPREAWAVLDYLQAQAAGRSLQEGGRWAQPVAAPDVPVVCDGQAAGSLRRWRGQRLRIVAVPADGDAAALLPQALREDPRLVTVALTSPGTAPPPGLRCHADDAAGWRAYAQVAGLTPSSLAGVQFLVDREGWLRARAPAGQAGWSDADFLCSAETQAAPRAGLGLEPLLARLDAEPVDALRGGVPHAALAVPLERVR